MKLFYLVLPCFTFLKAFKPLHTQVGEFKVKLVAGEMSALWDDPTRDELTVILPSLKRLLEEGGSTAIVAAWFLWAQEPLTDTSWSRSSASTRVTTRPAST